jgi:hypothetical protein
MVFLGNISNILGKIKIKLLSFSIFLVTIHHLAPFAQQTGRGGE